MSKFTVEDILNIYDPCRDHFEYFATSLEVDMLTKFLGIQLQQSDYIKMEVDSIGIVDGCLAIWPTDAELKKYMEKKVDTAAEKIIEKAFE
jgi:hypothetical protein